MSHDSGKSYDLTVLYVTTQYYVPFLLKSLASLPGELRKLVAWYSTAPIPAEITAAAPNVEVVPVVPTVENFHKSYALNRLLERVQTQWTMVSDADMLYPRIFGNALSLESERAIHRFFVARFTRAYSKSILSNNRDWETSIPMYSGKWVIPGRFSKLKRQLFGRSALRPQNFYEIYASQNPSIHATSLLKKVNGYDETLYGYGGEDTDLTRRCHEVGAIDCRVPLIVGHLYHPAVTDYSNYRLGSVFLRRERTEFWLRVRRKLIRKVFKKAA
ncbi:MAG: galactosyltransferase-related protein [Bdellovibrionota bacterium]